MSGRRLAEWRASAPSGAILGPCASFSRCPPHWSHGESRGFRIERGAKMTQGPYAGGHAAIALHRTQRRHPFTLPDGPPCAPDPGPWRRLRASFGHDPASGAPRPSPGHRPKISPKASEPAHVCPDPAGRRGFDLPLRPGAPVRPTQRGAARGLRSLEGRASAPVPRLPRSKSPVLIHAAAPRP